MSLLRTLSQGGLALKHVSREILPAVTTQVMCKRWHKPRGHISRKVDWYYREPGEDLDEAPKQHYTLRWKSTEDKLREGTWPWDYGIRSRFPDHYKKRYIELHQTPPQPVHYKPDDRKWLVDQYGVRTRVYNLPIPLIFPKQADEGLWGGEALVLGWRKKNNKEDKPKTPRIWKPQLKRRVLYSEILDKYMDITVTMRTLELIDQAYGFDSYILKTHQVDLASKLGMALKRNMIMKLIRKDSYPNDPAKQEEVYNKYKEFIIPEEEVAWLGLDLDEAEEKQRGIEEAEAIANTRPLKYMYAQDLITKIKDPTPEPEDSPPEVSTTSWLSRLNPFKDSETKT